MRPATGKIGPQFLDLLDRGARNDLIVRVHHRFEDDRVARINVQDRRLRIVEPAPLGRFHGRRKNMNFAGIPLCRNQTKLFLFRSRSRHEWQRGRRALRCGSRRALRCGCRRRWRR